MLKSITISNYKTFIQPTTIAFDATNYKFLEQENLNANRILKGAVFVGENASGKTNIIKAIQLILNILFGVNEIDYSSMRSFYTSDGFFDLEYCFSIDSSEICYHIKFDINGIVEEKLDIDKNTYLYRYEDTAEVRDANQTIKATGIATGLSYLRKFYFDTKFNGHVVLNKWFKFLNESVYINCYDHRIVSGLDNPKELSAKGYLEKNGVKDINDFFKKINYRQEISYSNETHNKKSTYNTWSTDKFISFKKAGTDTEIPIMYESIGNQTLINLLPSFMHTIKNSSMLIIDEFSSGLHNELEECLLKYFFHYSNDSQIFLVTHSTNILNNSIVRPDQVYSVKFDGSRGTVLKRFSDEMPREAQNIEKMYLNGIFDGKPYYQKTF